MITTFESICVLKRYVTVLRLIIDTTYKREIQVEIYLRALHHELVLLKQSRIFFRYIPEDEMKEDISGWNPSNTTHCCSKISSEILQDVLLGITLLRCDYRINLTQEDACIKEDPVCVQFSLRLTQQHFEFQKSRKEEVKERQIILPLSSESLQDMQSGITLF